MEIDIRLKKIEKLINCKIVNPLELLPLCETLRLLGEAMWCKKLMQD